MNPFQTNTYRGPQWFIDRVSETRTLSEAIKNDRNITLFSHRRMGKTMLIHHVFASLNKSRFIPLFIDLFASRNMVHFAQKLSEVLYEQQILHKTSLSKILGSLGASMSFDPVSGSPQINFNVTERSEVHKSIPQLFKTLSGLKKKVVIAFDEFQEVAGYEEDFAEAQIRTIMQENPNIVFLFSGSRKSMMREIFTDSNRPFFQSTQLMELNEIEKDVYIAETERILRENNKSAEPGIIRRILEDTYCHTGFSQMVLSRVYSESSKIIDDSIYAMVWADILENHKSMAREQEYLLPGLQWKILLAIARDGYVRMPQSHEFIAKHKLAAPSSMSRAVKALLDKGIIIDCGEKGLRLYNVFIEKNLKSFPIT